LWDPGDRGPLERTLIELRVPELGPVVFPAYAGTTVSVRAAGIATTLQEDNALRREVRAALASARASHEAPDDPELRREVARAVLFPPQTSPAAPPTGHPTEETETERSTDAPPEGHPPDTEDAPPTEGHPSTPTDAPPIEGHPSPTARAARMQYIRRSYVTRNGVGKTA
jgi:hypothetical protein